MRIRGFGWRGCLAWKLRFLADRISPETAFRKSAVSYEFVKWVGIVTNLEGKGCPLWYYGPDHPHAFERYDLLDEASKK